MISDYCKMEWEGLLKSAKENLMETVKISYSYVFVDWEREAPLGIQKDRINLLKNIYKVGKAICYPNDVANVAQATDELNISLI